MPQYTSKTIMKIFVRFFFVVVCVLFTGHFLHAQHVDNDSCLDSVAIANLSSNKFRLDTIIFTRKKYEVPGSPYQWVTFDSTSVTFEKSDGSSYSGSYYLYRNRIFFEINPMENGCFAINCFNGKEMSVNVYFNDLKTGKLKSAERTFVFGIVPKK